MQSVAGCEALLGERTWIDPHVDRSRWPRGAWDSEPDQARWTDEDTGLACLAKRHRQKGHWCGYVGVDSRHSWYGVSQAELEDAAEIHGAVTFAGRCDEGPVAQTACHAEEPGEPDELWWIGFHCHHAWDCSPVDLVEEAARGEWVAREAGEDYRTLGYVQSECRRLARQMAGSQRLVAEARMG